MGQNNTWNPAQLNQRINELEASGTGSDLPEVTSADNGKALQVVNGAWAIGDTITVIKKQYFETTTGSNGRVLIATGDNKVPVSVVVTESGNDLFTDYVQSYQGNIVIIGKKEDGSPYAGNIKGFYFYVESDLTVPTVTP